MRSLTIKEEDFGTAVLRYRNALTREHHGDSDGDTLSSDMAKRKIIELYHASEEQSKLGLLYIAIKTMSASIVSRGHLGHSNSSEKLIAWLRDLGDQLTDELEKI